MDKGTAAIGAAAGIALIKTHMPQTYAAIQDKAAEVGNVAYQWVRQACNGQPNRFYAVEAGHVVGTPFDQAVTADLAALMVQFGCGFLVLWPLPQHRDVSVGSVA